MSKYGADKIALFGLFILSLLVARLITTSRSAIVFSEPIGLSYTGLSVSMPSGNGWRTAERWEYHENAFVLSGVFLPVSPKPTTTVQCRYLLAAPQINNDIQFQQEVNDLGGEIAETGSLQADTLAVYWVRIKGRDSQHTVFFATAQLPNGRQFEIELLETAGDIGRARNVFMGVVESLKFEDVPMLAAGSRVVAEVKNRGLGEFLHRPPEKSSGGGAAVRAKNGREFFLIRDAARQPIGFTMDVSTFPQQPSGMFDDSTVSSMDVRIVSLLYVRGRYPQEQVSVFKCNNSFEEFFWRSEDSSLAGTTAAEITSQQTGLMTVTQFAPQHFSEKYQLSPAAIPDFLFDCLLNQMLDDDCRQIMADLVEAQGRIIPTLMSKVEIGDTNDLEDQARFAFKLEFLDGRGFSEMDYLDSQHQVIKRILREQGMYILERTDAKTVMEIFPERAEYILQYGDKLGAPL